MTTKYQLKNGMKVLLIESHKSPVVSIQMWVKTGSADEGPGIEGISHFIEHLVFKGSEKFKVGEMANAVESAGGLLNAYTTFDQTVFYVTLSKDFTDTGLEVISQMMGHPLFDSKEIDNEREVVLEEIKRSNDNPHQQASRLLFSTVYQKHPYRVPVIGYDDNIRHLPKEKIVKYYQGRYLPNNMNLVIVGDFASPEMKKKITSFFSGFKKRKLLTVRRKVEPKQSRPRVQIQKSPYAESYVYLSWPAPNVLHKDIVPLSLLSIIFGQGDSSRLVHTLRYEKHLVSSVGCSLFSPKDRGFLAISATLQRHEIKETLYEVGKEMEKLLQKGVTKDELEKAIRILESDKFYSMETVDGLAGLYGHFEFLYNDYKYFDKMLKQINKVTSADIVRVARKYFSAEAVNVTCLLAEKAKLAEEEVHEWLKGVAAGTKNPKNIKDKPLRAKGMKWKAAKENLTKAPKIWTDENGVKIILKEIKGSPVSSVRVGYLGGLRYENGKLGLNELSSRIWTAGYGNFPEAKFNHEIENLASSIGAFGGRNTIGMSLTSLQPFTEKAFEHFVGIITDPHLPEEAVLREKKLMAHLLQTRKDKPSQVCMLNLVKSIFEGHP